MKGLFEVRKEDAYQAAWNAKRDILKYRMRRLRKAAVESLAPLKISVFARRVLGLPQPPEPSEQEIRKRMRELWHDSHRITDYRIGAWGTMGTAREIIDACRACCSDTIFLSGSDAAFVHEHTKIDYSRASGGA